MYRLFLLVVALQLAAVACSQKKAENSVPASVQAVNEYPDLLLRLGDGTEIRTKELTGKNVFVLFQPDCDHCQQVAVQIEQRLEEFKNYTLYFISSSPMENIMAF